MVSISGSTGHAKGLNKVDNSTSCCTDTVAIILRDSAIATSFYDCYR